MTTFYASYPPNVANAVPTYANLAAFPSAATAGNGALAIALDTDILYISTGSAWSAIGGPGVPLSMGTIDSEGSPSANGATISANTLIMQSASATAPGLINTGSQTFSGVKTFNSAPNMNSLSASQAVVTDGSKNLASLAYTTTATASTLAQRDGVASISANNFIANYTNTVSSGGTITLTLASSRVQNLSGSSNETYQLPNAFSLTGGQAVFEFNNNSTGSLIVQDFSAGAVCTIPSGGYARVILLTGGSSAGTWDVHYQIPSNSSWGTAGASVTGTLAATSTVQGTQLISTIATGTAPLVVSSTTQVANLNVATAGSFSGNLSGDVTGTQSATVLSNQKSAVYVDFILGNDSTGTGSIVNPWKTLSHAYASISPTLNDPYVIYLSGGNNDADIGSVTAKPNVTLTADYPIEVTGNLTITGGTSNDGCTFNNIIFVGSLTWIRNDGSLIGVTFYNCQFFSGPTIEQNGSGGAQVTAYDSLFVNSVWRTPLNFALFFNCAFYGTVTLNDVTSAVYYQFIACYYDGAISISGGPTVYFSGCSPDTPLGASLTGVSTANGSPVFQFDSGSVPPTISGSFSTTLISHAQWEAYSPTTSANWNSIPSTVQSGLDDLAGTGIVKSQAKNLFLATPSSISGVPSFRAIASSDLPAGTGTVTSVAMTVPGFLSISGSPITTSGTLAVSYSGSPLPVLNGGTGLTTGTSGGILGFTSSGTLASSPVLTANQLVIGGGSGVTPSALAAGTQYQVLTMGVANPGYGAVNLAQSAAVTGILPIANGGTNSSTTLNSNRFIVSSGGAIVEAAAVTASKVVVSDTNGLPAAATTSTTQVQYLASATGTTGTTSTNLVFSTSPTLVTPTIGAASATSVNFGQSDSLDYYDVNDNRIAAGALSNHNGSGSITGASVAGGYVSRIGKMVFVQLQCDFTMTTATGALQVTLPFTAASSTRQIFNITCTAANNGGAQGTGMVAFDTGTSTTYFLVYASTTSTLFGTGSNSTVGLEFWYQCT